MPSSPAAKKSICQCCSIIERWDRGDSNVDVWLAALELLIEDDGILDERPLAMAGGRNGQQPAV
jgi:hypothetical protein